MAFPTTREELKQWALRKLGKGAIRINVTDEQCEDRIDETLERFREHHFDGVERVYYKRAVTASNMKFDSALGFDFIQGEEINGVTSLAKGRIYSQADNNLSIKFTTLSEEQFQAGEVINGADGHTATISGDADAIELGDKDNGWVPIDDSIVSVVQLVPSGGLLGQGLFSYTYQMALQFLPTFPSGDLHYYFMQRQHLALIENLFVGQKVIRFQRMQNRLHVDINWRHGIDVGQYLFFDCYKAVDPTTYSKVFSNWFVREYTTALIKQQWASNLGKFDKVVLPNGTMVNRDKISEEAERKLEELEDKLRNELQVPPGFYVG